MRRYLPEAGQRRRRFWKGAAVSGVTAVFVPKAWQLANIIGPIKDGSLPESSNFIEFSSIKIGSNPELKYIFFGNSHDMVNIHKYFDRYISVIKLADYIHLEASVPNNNFSKYLDITQTKDDEEMRSLVFVLGDDVSGGNFGSWFRVISALAARYGKPVIISDPESTSGMNSAEIAKKLNGALLPVIAGKYITLLLSSITAIAGLKSQERGELYAKISTGLLGSHLALDAASKHQIELVSELISFCNTYNQAPGIGQILEFSWINYRDFVSVAGLFAIRDKSKKEGKPMSGNIAGMYGAGHFRIQQILQLPESIIKAKLKLYRYMLDKLVGQEVAGKLYYDFLREGSNEKDLSATSGPWHIVSEASVFDWVDGKYDN